MNKLGKTEKSVWSPRLPDRVRFSPLVGIVPGVILDRVPKFQLRFKYVNAQLQDKQNNDLLKLK